MALNEKTLRVLIKFDADTSKAKDGLKGVQSEAEKTKKSIGSIGDAFGALDGPVEKLKRTWGDLSSVVSFGVDVFHHALERSRIETGALGVSIEGLRKAAGGLRTDLDLQRDALVFNQTALKGNQKAMEDVERAQRALIARGNDEQKVHEAVTQALTKLETDGLRPFGIAIDKAGLSMDDNADRAELLKRVYAALRQESMGVNDEQLTQQERLAATGVTFENSVDTMKKALEQMVLALAPLVEKVAWFVANIPQLMKSMQQGSVGKGAAQAIANPVIGVTTLFGAATGQTSQDFGAPGFEEDISADSNNLEDTYQQWIARTQRARRAALAGNKALANSETAGFGTLPTGPGIGAPNKNYKGKSARDAFGNQPQARGLADLTDSGLEALGELLLKLDAGQAKIEVELDKFTTSNLFIGDARDTSDIGNVQRHLTGEDQRMQVMNLKQYAEAVKDMVAGTVDAVVSAGDAAEAFRAKNGKKTALEHMFGPIEDFKLYQDAFNALTGSVTAGMDAWITGSMSAGDAVKKFIAGAIKAEAGLMAVEAIKHLAYALGSLAFGDAKGASMHGLAAAKFGAGAVLAAVVAREMGHGGTDYSKQGGGGGSGGGGSSSAAPSYYGGGNGSRDNGRTVIYVVGDPFDENATPRQRQQNMRSQLERVTAVRGGEY